MPNFDRGGECNIRGHGQADILTTFGVYLVSIFIEQEVDFSGMKRNNRKRRSTLNTVFPSI